MSLALVTHTLATSCSPVTPEPGTAAKAWRDYSDRLAVELAIDAAARRIAQAYAR